jgi:pimeloyl-ACP methyl ester carboxylesterase
MRLSCRGSGDPILFIHGIPTSNQLWTGIIERLSGQFACFTLDLPGLGSEASKSCPLGQLNKIAKEIDALRVEAGIKSWNVVGHDAGSAIAVLYTRLFSQYVNRLSLLAPALFPELRPFYLFEILRKPVLGELLAPCINALIWRLAMHRACQGEDGNGDSVVSTFRAPFTGPLGAWHMMRVLRWGKPSEVLAEMPSILPQLRTPTLIFHGAHDPAIPEAFARRASALIPDAKLLMLDAGHFIPLNRPEMVAHSLRQFFESRPVLPAAASTDAGFAPEQGSGSMA